MAATQTPIEKLLECNEKRRLKILVVGDLLIDRYEECSCERISPEAPCPILKTKWHLELLGGAGNVARQLEPWNVDAVLRPAVCANAPIKKRYCVDGRIVFRVDEEERIEMGVGAESFLLSDCTKLIRERPDAVIVSDYGKGTIGENLARRLVSLCQDEGIPLVVDSKNHRHWWEGCWCYQVDLARSGKRLDDVVSKSVDEVWCDSSGFKRVVQTRGSQPPHVYDDTVGIGKVFRVEQVGPPVNAISVSGAGDHFAAILTLALAHGLPINEAASLAHESGCYYVTRLYNEPVLPHELHSRFDPVSAKIATAEKLRNIFDIRKPERIVFANGVWSVIHAGHLATLEFAKKQGDVLVVAVNSDDSAERVKGKKPVVPDWQRARVLAGLSCVDFVVMFSHSTPEDEIRIIKPKYLVKGPDQYLNPNIPGKDLVEEVRFAPQTKALLHTSEMLEKNREQR